MQLLQCRITLNKSPKKIVTKKQYMVQYVVMNCNYNESNPPCDSTRVFHLLSWIAIGLVAT